ncbi:MAG: acyl-CoA dehydrogenase family protein [Dehalococcoidia bacterium]
MNFEFSEEHNAFREEVRAFLRRTLTPEFWERHRARGGGGSSPEFSKAAGREGWLAIAWPAEYGGRGLSYTEQMIYMEEMVLAGAPIEHHRRAVQQVGPSIMLFGTEEQKQSFLPRIASGDLSFAMGLSEPNAGSDLAGVETTGVRSGDDWIVNGRKRYTSGAHYSEFLWTMTRTDPDAPKHRGISMFAIPLASPGVRVEPLIDMQGRHHFNQVFLEDVRVPAKNLIGEENRGWYVNAATLDFERSGIARYSFLRRTLDRAENDLRTLRNDRVEIPETGAQRRRIADAAIRTEVGKNLAYRVTALQNAGALPNYEVSIAKLTITETIQQVCNAGVNLHGMHGLLSEEPAVNDEGSPTMEWGPLYLDAVRHTIGQGAAEIQRNVVANRGLGLPRG